MDAGGVRNVVVDGAKNGIEARLGDMCCTSNGFEIEKLFDILSKTREDVIAQGLDKLKRRLVGKTVTYPDGRPYDWQ